MFGNHICYFNFISFTMHACVLCPIGGHLSPHYASQKKRSKAKAFCYQRCLCVGSFFHSTLNIKRCCYGNVYLLNNEYGSPMNTILNCSCLLGMEPKHVSFPHQLLFCVTIEKRKICFRYFVVVTLC